MNKTIYMTYKKPPPDKVLTRWKDLNPEYAIDVSLDNDCMEFIKTNFNDHLSELFKTTYNGMNKADLWRLCKLYIHGGVYADVDLVPYLNVDHLNKEITFFTSVSKDQLCFQDFLLSRTPKSPLLLALLLSLISNKNLNGSGPRIDMYKCLRQILETNPIEGRLYRIKTIKIKINIGPSSNNNNKKAINLFYFPTDLTYSIVLNENPYPDQFNFVIENNILTVTRIDDAKLGWGHHHSCSIIFSCDEKIYLFKENSRTDDSWPSATVTDNGVKLFDSHDEEYVRNKGW
jgi:hypothetical protein